MPAKPPTDITNRIQQLLSKREEHASAIVAIDATLARVGAALSSNGHRVANASMPAAPKVGRKGKRTRRTFAISGEQLVLDFIKKNSNPMGREIEKHWKSEGRSGSAANELTKLVKLRKLKRTPLKDERGSRYSLI